MHMILYLDVIFLIICCSAAESVMWTLGTFLKSEERTNYGSHHTANKTS